MLQAFQLVIEVFIGLAVGSFVVYVLARLVTLAYFHSRADYDYIISRRRRASNQLEGT